MTFHTHYAVKTLHFTSTGMFHHHLVTDSVYLEGEIFTISLFSNSQDILHRVS